jgi:hypothetical protein
MFAKQAEHVIFAFDWFLYFIAWLLGQKITLVVCSYLPDMHPPMCYEFNRKKTFKTVINSENNLKE